MEKKRTLQRGMMAVPLTPLGEALAADTRVVVTSGSLPDPSSSPGPSSSHAAKCSAFWFLPILLSQLIFLHLYKLLSVIPS